PKWRMDGITFAWVGSAFELARRFEDRRLLAGVTTPVLLACAGVDDFVDVHAHRRAASILPHCRHIEFHDAKHELFLASDPIRNRWFEAIDRFLGAVGVPAVSNESQGAMAPTR